MDFFGYSAVLMTLVTFLAFNSTAEWAPGLLWVILFFWSGYLFSLVRRCHDVGWSGWWALLAWIPLIGLIQMIVLCFMPGEQFGNRFGVAPLASGRGIKQKAIFIGYRREDTADVAGRIYDVLEGSFGRGSLFKDVDSLRPGADFGGEIRKLLPRCRVALILIGPQWMDARDEQGRSRLNDPQDWVRIEIETALATAGLAVVPVLVNGARMPRAVDIPRSLQPLLHRHAAVIRRDPDFRDDVGRLANVIGAGLRTGAFDLDRAG